MVRFLQYCPSYMACIWVLMIMMMMLSVSSIVSAQDPPPPGYYPSSGFDAITFDQGFRNLWGPQHQIVDQGSLTIWLDSSSG